MKVGDRVRRKQGGQGGIVEKVDLGKAPARQALVHWGTIDGRKVESWVPFPELEPVTEHVYSPDEVLARQGRKVEEDKPAPTPSTADGSVDYLQRDAYGDGPTMNGHASPGA